MLLIAACKPGTRLVQIDLYFGQSRSDGTTIGDSVVKIFIDKHVGLVFRKGFTVIQAEGKWYDDSSGITYSEESFIISCTDTMTENLSAGIDSLREKYKAAFQQSAVLRVDKEVLSISN